MTETLLRVLVVDQPDAVEPWQGVLSPKEKGERGVQVVCCTEVSSAISRLRSEPFEVALMAVGSSEALGLEGICRLLAEGPEIATIAIVDATNMYAGREAVRLGAEDCWVRGELTDLAMRHSLRCALDRHRRMVDLRARWLEELKKRDGDTQIATGRFRRETLHALRLKTLQVAAPLLFESMVNRYQDQLDSAFEARLYRDVPRDPISKELKSMASDLQSVTAGPRDVADIHTTALRRRLIDEPPLRAAIHVEEARVLSLELMGQLASLYRNAWLARGGLVREGDPTRTGRR
jgi:DNA-binding NarL/FixJ family response regulator